MQPLFKSTITTARDVFGEKFEEGFNSNVPEKFWRVSFKKETLLLFPEEIRNEAKRQLNLFVSFPCRQSDLITSLSLTIDFQLITYRVYIVDPLDDRGCFPYRGQGYIPYIVIVKAGQDEKWTYV